MARFKWRAPYFKSVPSLRRKPLASSVVLKTKDLSGEVLKIRCWTMFNSMSRIFLSSLVPSGLKVTILSRRLMNSGVNLRLAASAPLRMIFPLSFSSTMPFWDCRAHSPALKPSRGLIRALISVAPRLLVMKMSAREKSTLRLSPNVSVPLSRMPSNKFHSASLAFSISSNKHETQLAGVGVILIQHFLAQQRMRFAMSQISGRRADQLRNLVTVLEFRAIDLDDCARIAH